MKRFHGLIAGLLVAAFSAAVAGCAAPSPWRAVPSPPAAAKPAWQGPRHSSTNRSGSAESPHTLQVRGQNAGYPAPQTAPFALGPGGYPRRPMPVSGQPNGPPELAPSSAPYTTYQPPVVSPPGAPSPALGGPPPPGPAAPGTPLPGPAPSGAPQMLPPVTLPPPGGELGLPPNFADIEAVVEEARTGRFMFGVGVNSSAGVTGQIVLDERNFDITRFPTSFQDFIDGTAFRGAGQGFRLEALPGDRVQRYLGSFTEPYLFDTPISLSVSGFFYDRIFFDWDEQRLGGRVALGYRLTHDLSISAAVRAERIEIRNPRVTSEPQLNRVIGQHDLYSGQVTLTHDTRDMPFAPTEGHFIELSFQQAFGAFDYPRGDIDFRRYHLVLERPDGSGRHTLSYGIRLGFSGSQTPIYDNYFAGGFSTLRGFDFRGASPVGSEGVIVGGQFRLLGSVEYLFPLTADDMMRGVFFCDFGTVEKNVRLNGDTFRVAPGFGLRINVPAMGPAPLAFDFAFPIASAPSDDEEVFSFFIGFGRL